MYLSRKPTKRLKPDHATCRLLQGGCLSVLWASLVQLRWLTREFSASLRLGGGGGGVDTSHDVAISCQAKLPIGVHPPLGRIACLRESVAAAGTFPSILRTCAHAAERVAGIVVHQT